MRRPKEFVKQLWKNHKDLMLEERYRKKDARKMRAEKDKLEQNLFSFCVNILKFVFKHGKKSGSQIDDRIKSKGFVAGDPSKLDTDEFKIPESIRPQDPTVSIRESQPIELINQVEVLSSSNMNSGEENPNEEDTKDFETLNSVTIHDIYTNQGIRTAKELVVWLQKSPETLIVLEDSKSELSEILKSVEKSQEDQTVTTFGELANFIFPIIDQVKPLIGDPMYDRALYREIILKSYGLSEEIKQNPDDEPIKLIQWLIELILNQIEVEADTKERIKRTTQKIIVQRQKD